MLAAHAHPVEAPAQQPADVTLVLSTLHVSQPDLDRLRQHGWLLACWATDHQVGVALPALDGSDEQRNEFLARLCASGYTRGLADLVFWACDAGVEFLVFDDAVAPSDRLLPFVG